MTFETNLSTCRLPATGGDAFWFLLQSMITVLNTTAIVLNVFFVCVILSATVMHRNMRLMLTNISICFSMESLAGLLYNFYFLTLGVSGFPQRPKQSWPCTLINVLMVPWDAAAILLVVGLGAERFIAMRRVVPAGEISCYVKLIFTATWTAAGLVTVQYVLHLTNKPICICDGASLSDRSGMLVRIAIIACLEAATILLYSFVLVTSKRRLENFGINTARYSLANRFQMYETFRVTQMLMPSILLHSFVYMSYLMLLVPLRDYRASPDISLTGFNLTTLAFALPAVHASAHPLICISRHYYMRQKAVAALHRLFPPLERHAESTTSNPQEGESMRLSARDSTPQRCSFAEQPARVEFRMAPEKHSEILTTFWERSS